jgi:16S rRNA (guanine527-N7)-methyltransferase
VPAVAEMEKGHLDEIPSGAPHGPDGWIHEIGRRLGLEIPDRAAAQYLEYFRLIREWNEKVNLTAVLDDEGMAVKHLLDSLTLLPFIEKHESAAGSGSKKPFQLVDVGSGAGFPGLPVKIVRPDLRVVLLDALDKRVKFLETVICTLELQDIAAIHSRAEDAARNANLRENFDIAVSRAVASLPILCEYCLPFVKTGGLFLAMKGPSDSENTSGSSRAVNLLGGELYGIDSFVLPGTDIRRTIIQIRKIRPTPAAYPRRPGLPEKRPLI